MMYLTLRDVIHLPCPCTYLQCKQSGDIIGGVVNKLRVPHVGKGCCATCGAQIPGLTNKICPSANCECDKRVIGLGNVDLLHACLAETGNGDLDLCFAIPKSKLSEGLRRSHKDCDVMVEPQRRCYNERVAKFTIDATDITECGFKLQTGQCL